MEIINSFDVLIIGGGPGGYHAGNCSAKAGLKTGLFEGKSLGGVCLNEGCIPSKTFLKSAKIANECNHAELYGVSCKGGLINQKNVKARKDDVVSKLVMGVRGGLRKNKVKLFFNYAKIVGKEDDKYIIESDNKFYSCKNLIIATGSKVLIPPIKGAYDMLEKGSAITSSEILNLEHIPSELVVIGGGIIGLEMAVYFAFAGSKVSVVEFADKICADLDRECSDILLKNLEKQGVKFYLSTKAEEIKENCVVCNRDGTLFEIPCDLTLISTGRKPSLDGYGLENLDVDCNSKQGILTDKSLRTSLKGLYAVGDVNGRKMLAHTAYREAEVAVDNITGKSESEVNYNCIPACIYTCPEAGWVGESEESAKEKGISYSVYKLPMIYSGRFVAENIDSIGICKILTENGSNKIIGGAIVGDYASEIISVLSNMIALKLTVKDIDKLVFPHPTVCEIIKETINN